MKAEERKTQEGDQELPRTEGEVSSPAVRGESRGRDSNPRKWDLQSHA